MSAAGRSASTEPQRERAWRATIQLEDAEVIGQQAWPGEQFVLRLHAPASARRA
jgi:hypothetical protein